MNTIVSATHYRRLINHLLVISLCLLFPFQAAQAQMDRLSPQIMANAGGYFCQPNQTLNLSFTLGEPIIGLGSSERVELTQGFQQAKLVAYPRVTSALWQHRISVFPNPAQHYLSVRFNLLETTDFSVALFSSIGQRIITWECNAQQDIRHFELPEIPRGLYNLVAFDQNMDRMASFIIIKN